MTVFGLHKSAEAVGMFILSPSFYDNICYKPLFFKIPREYNWLDAYFLPYTQITLSCTALLR